MRHLPYKWQDVLEEETPRTLIGLELLHNEKEMERKELEKAKRKSRR